MISLCQAKEDDVKRRMSEHLRSLETQEELRSTYLKITLQKVHSARVQVQEGTVRAIKNLLASAEQVNPTTDLLQYIEYIQRAWSHVSESGAAAFETTLAEVDEKSSRNGPPGLAHLNRR